MPRRIPTHRPPSMAIGRRAYERSADRKADKAFYDSAAWLRLRGQVLAEEPLCRRCTSEGRVAPAQHVHHVKARKDCPELALDRSNLMALCQRCHNKVRHIH